MADNYDWWVNRATGRGAAAGAQQASPATERAELEAAIAAGQRALVDRPTAHDSEYKFKHIGALVEAARKHLETLPKPMWRVTGWLQEGTDRRAADFEAYSRKEAIDFARGYLEQGMRWVTVTQVQS